MQELATSCLSGDNSPSGINKRSSGIEDGDRNGPRNIGAPTAQPFGEAASPRTFYRTLVTVKTFNCILYVMCIIYIIYFTCIIYIKVKVKVKWSRYRPGVARRVDRGIALLFHDRDTRRG